MTPIRRAAALLCLTLSLGANAASHVAATAEDVERLDTSVAALLQALERINKEQASRSAATATIHNVTEQRNQAKGLSARGDQTEALRLMNEALVSLKIRIAELKKASTAPTQEQEGSDYLTEKRQGEIDHLNASLNALMTALERIGEEKGRTELVNEIGAQVHQHQQSALALSQQSALLEARNELDQAMVTVKTAIAALRNRETLVRSLNFANKEEEYRYEQDRYETYGMLINLLTEKRRFDDSTIRQIEGFKEEARAQQRQAESSARTGDFEQAVKQQEGSNRSLLKAIRRGGIYVPG